MGWYGGRTTPEGSVAHAIPAQRRPERLAPVATLARVPGQPLPVPDDVLPPLGPPPGDPLEQAGWLEPYRERRAFARAAAELRKAVADADRAEIELADARRR